MPVATAAALLVRTARVVDRLRLCNPAGASVTDAAGDRQWRRESDRRRPYLSPEIVRAILVGQRPVELTPARLVMFSRTLSHDWQEQRRLSQCDREPCGGRCGEVAALRENRIYRVANEVSPQRKGRPTRNAA